MGQAKLSGCGGMRLAPSPETAGSSQMSAVIERDGYEYVFGGSIVTSRQGPSAPQSWRIESASQTQWPAIADALADAFYSDPVYSWMLPVAGTRRGALRRFFAIEGKHAVLPHCCSFAATEANDTVGAGLVLPPGHWRKPIRIEARHAANYAGIFRQRLGHAVGLLAALERRHPRYPHFYLPYIGVLPAMQGQRVGTALLTEILRVSDDCGLPTYLEASSAESARLYRRHGFVTTQVVRPLGAPPIELMLRRSNR